MRERLNPAQIKSMENVAEEIRKAEKRGMEAYFCEIHKAVHKGYKGERAYQGLYTHCYQSWKDSYSGKK